jgi:acyl carrier protein
MVRLATPVATARPPRLPAWGQNGPTFCGFSRGTRLGTLGPALAEVLSHALEARMDDIMIFHRLKQILVADFAKDEALVTPKATLRGTLMMDSLDLVDLMFFLQREFQFDARLEELRDVKSLDALVDFIVDHAEPARAAVG